MQKNLMPSYQQQTENNTQTGLRRSFYSTATENTQQISVLTWKHPWQQALKA